MFTWQLYSGRKRHDRLSSSNNNSCDDDHNINSDNVAGHFGTTTLDATRLFYRYSTTSDKAFIRDADPAPPSTEQASPPPPHTDTNTPPPPCPYMNRLFKIDPLVLVIALRCGWEEAKTPSPTGMLHSTFSNDEQRYLPNTTATSGSGLQHQSAASYSGPSHPEPASTTCRRLYPRLS